MAGAYTEVSDALAGLTWVYEDVYKVIRRVNEGQRSVNGGL